MHTIHHRLKFLVDFVKGWKQQLEAIASKTVIHVCGTTCHQAMSLRHNIES